MPKKQNGFSIIMVILVIAIVGLMSCVGWLLWDRMQNNQVVKTDKNVSQTSPKPSVNVIPNGYSEYKNQDFAIKFYYPTEWGTPMVSPDFEMKWGHVSAGKGIEISFSQNKNVTAAIRSKDWTHNLNMGHGGVDNVLYFSPDKPYDPSTNQRDNYKIYFNDQNGYFALTPLCGEGQCDYMALVLIKNISNNANTNGVAIVYKADKKIILDPTDYGYSQQAIDALPWAANFPPTLIDQFKTVNSSISNL